MTEILSLPFKTKSISIDKTVGQPPKMDIKVKVCLTCWGIERDIWSRESLVSYTAVRLEHYRHYVVGWRHSGRECATTVSETGKITKNKMSQSMIKPTKCHVSPVKTQNNLGIHPVWSEIRCPHEEATHWAHSEAYDQSGWSESLLVAQVILLVLSWCSSNKIWSSEKRL